jgi:hypothetical protein
VHDCPDCGDEHTCERCTKRLCPAISSCPIIPTAAQ